MELTRTDAAACIRYLEDAAKLYASTPGSTFHRNRARLISVLLSKLKSKLGPAPGSVPPSN